MRVQKREKVVMFIIAALFAAIGLVMISGLAGGLAATQPVGLLGICEIAWAGTAHSPSDEYFEICGADAFAVETEGWYLEITKTDNSTSTIMLPSTRIEVNGMALFERTDDDTVSTVVADGIYSGGLINSGLVSLDLMTPEGVISHHVAMMEGDWIKGSTSPRASMQWVNSGWHTSNDGDELDAGGKRILGTPGSYNGLPIANPLTCGTLPEEVAFDLNLILHEEDMTTSVEIVLDAPLWGVAGDGSLIESDGRIELVWSGAWDIVSIAWSDSTSNECINAIEMLASATENILNGRPSNTGDTLPDYWIEYSAKLNGVLKFQKSGISFSFLPVVTNDE